MMTRFIIALTATFLLVGCGSIPTQDEVWDSITVAKQPSITYGTDKVTGQAPVEKRLEQMKALGTMYQGRPMEGVFTKEEIHEIYKFTRYEVTKYGIVLIYESDLGLMQIKLVRSGKKHKHSANVPFPTKRFVLIMLPTTWVNEIRTVGTW